MLFLYVLVAVALMTATIITSITTTRKPTSTGITRTDVSTPVVLGVLTALWVIIAFIFP